MKTKTTCLLGGVLAFAMSGTVTAQTISDNNESLMLERTVVGASKTEISTEFPTLKGRLADDGINAMFSRPLLSTSPAMPVGPLTVNTGLEIWGNVIRKLSAGIYAFSPTPSMTFTELSPYKKFYFNAGSGLIGNELHGIYLNTASAASGAIYLYHYAFNTDTWELAVNPERINDYSLIALETAVDPTTGEVFGEFFSSNLQKKEWGVVNYKTMKRTSIGSAQRTYVALGITSDGRAFGVAEDGNLYQIDRTTGAETLKGSTGIRIMNTNGEHFFQSGEIDPKTNEFYWASKNSDGDGVLYTVDLNDGHVTRISSFGDATITSMTIPVIKAADGAPDMVTNLQASFDGPATSGKISFTAPTKKFDGSALSGRLAYSISANGDEIAAGYVNAGENVSSKVQAQEGVVAFSVVTSNAAGNGPRAKVVKYIGYDTPNPVSDVKLNIDASRNVTLSWTAPTAGTHGGHMGEITYDIFRYKGTDTTQVASSAAGTTFNERLPKAAITSYSYGVRAVNTTRKSDIVTSDNKVFGDALEPPFTDDFQNPANAYLYTIVDKNNDGSTWRWYHHSIKGGVFRYNHSKTNKANDWLITPPVHLEAGKTYNVSFKASSSNNKFIEKLEVKWGNKPTPLSLTRTLMGETELKGVYEDFEKQIKPTQTGTYYIGFHAISDPDRYYLYMGGISIEEAANKNAPAAVSDLKATADPTGELKARITFKAPATTMDGKPLGSINKIEVRSGSRLVKSISQPALGAEQIVNDNAAQQGENVYTVIASNTSDGAKATVKVFVGQDVPNAPLGKAADLTTSVRINWNEPTGVNGGIIIPSKMTYDIYDVTDDNKLGNKLASVAGNKTEYTVAGFHTDEGAQRYKQWAISATNGAGTSKFGIASLIVGKPYTLPFHDSFKDGRIDNQFTGLEYSTQAAAWNTDKNKSSDDDDGSLIFRPKEAGHSTVLTGKISLKGASSPKLIFDYYAKAAANAKLEMTFQHRDGSIDTAPIWQRDFNAETAPGQWNNVVVELPAALTAEDYVILRIKATADADLSATPIYVDNINIADPLQRDAAISISAPDKVRKGQTAKLKITLSNLGLDKLENAKLKITADDKPIHEATVDRKLAMLQEAQLTVDYKTTSLDKAERHSIKAEIIVDGDLDDENNTATASLALEKADVPTPKDFKGTDNGSRNMKLTWKAPENKSELITDNFESYEAWGTDFGRWTTVDADQGYALPLSDQGRYKHQGEQFAFINWQPSDIFGKGQGLTPHSGTRTAVAMYQSDKQQKTAVAADNWLISPQLSGRAQTISFWVNNVNAGSHGAESFDVLTSSTDKQLEHFVKIGNTHTQNTARWTEISLPLPEGTRYFAIHHITAADKAFLFMLDDATFETGNTPVCYNVYRDGELIGSTAETTLTDLLPAASASHTYMLTAVYDDGSESEPVVLTMASGITAPAADGTAAYDVYTLDGALVARGLKSLKSLRRGAYVINGRKCVVR